MTTAFRIGTLAQDAVTGIKFAFASPSTTNYMTLELTGGVDYQVTAGKTFYITRIDFTSATANTYLHLGYADDGVPDQAGAPTNPITLTGNLRVDTAYKRATYDVFIPVPATKYIFVKSGVNDAAIIIQGIEL